LIVIRISVFSLSSRIRFRTMAVKSGAEREEEGESDEREGGGGVWVAMSV
jgi:hypothetical protein